MSLTHKQAKALKDAGFPQEKKKGYFWSSEGTFSDPTDEQIENYGMSYVPTLEELIDECGDHLQALEHLVDPDDITGWSAFLREAGISYHGLTPIEAVHALYLALHKKI